MTIAIVELGISNIASVLGALQRVGAPPLMAARPENVGTAGAILVPGVGAFGEGIASIRRQGLEEPIRAAARSGVPVLGICLGMQLLAETSDEHGQHTGLGLIPGNVRKLAEGPDARVPNIGWCDVSPARRGVLFPDDRDLCCYHVHSFHLVTPERAAVAATIRFGGEDVVVAVEHGTVFGMQFHPEKSQDDGLLLLDRFLSHLRQLGRLN